MKRFLIIILLFYSVTSVAQSNTELIGFTCFEDGSESAHVLKFTKLLRNSKWKLIGKHLFSESEADQFLTVVVLEYLDSASTYRLTENQRRRIEKIKVSPKEVWICSGCVDFKRYQLKELFLNPDYIIDRTKDWLKKYLKTK